MGTASWITKGVVLDSKLVYSRLAERKFRMTGFNGFQGSHVVWTRSSLKLGTETATGWVRYHAVGILIENRQDVMVRVQILLNYPVRTALGLIALLSFGTALAFVAIRIALQFLDSTPEWLALWLLPLCIMLLGLGMLGGVAVALFQLASDVWAASRVCIR